ncbi:sarcosine oxidase subunit beta [Tistlia consotensis]|uniref:Sarcosine oxidase subunit beta n=1 Tax=Tistlia consotensis USBA 355 TaxID=560819 RepID=A0A1Y6B7V8_9PROT|nr:FAD-dependent oxidoreductase [Tistlia consotensis]SME89780.1 sarcosine oxidase subunit beta [Tistlia consotensis USBA 355]SNR26303.1 sarcosine oxidase subunit beta [Tistlia consotensis]
MAERFDAIVIGAGVIGAAVGLELARKGWKTLNLDRLPTAGYGSTGGSCAIIRTHYSTVEGAALAYEGYFYWKDWAGHLGVEDERGLARFHDTGCLVMKTESNGQLRKIVANMASLGIPYQEWDAATVERKLPHLRLDRFAPAKRPEDPGFGEPTGGRLEGGVFFPAAGYINDPQLSAHNLQRAAEAAGGTFRFNARVTEIRKDGEGRIAGVTLADGSAIDAPVVVNVAGPHSYKLNEMAGATGDMTIKTRALKQEVVHVPMPVADWDKVGIVTSDSDISCYTRPEKGNFLLIGSEDPECDPREWVDPDDYDTNFTEQWRIQALRTAQRIPTLGIPSQMKGVVELYDVSDDWIPIYDASSVPGWYMAIGTSGNQFKNAPVAGVMMAELVEKVQAGHDHDAEPLQLHLRHTGRTIDLGFYSRRREINRESSFSVLG